LRAAFARWQRTSVTELAWPAALHREDDDIVAYEAAVVRMQQMVRQRRDGVRPDTLWLLSHPQLFTVGRRTPVADWPSPRHGIPVLETRRGGQLTYHGPGQLVGYVIVDIGQSANVVRFVRLLEERLVAVIETFGIAAERRESPPGGPLLTGVWATDTGRKLVSIGLRCGGSVTSHGFSINVDGDLEPWTWVTPCGMPDVQMTSIARELGHHRASPPTTQQVREVVSDVFRAGRMLS